MFKMGHSMELCGKEPGGKANHEKCPYCDMFAHMQTKQTETERFWLCLGCQNTFATSKADKLPEINDRLKEENTELRSRIDQLKESFEETLNNLSATTSQFESYQATNELSRDFLQIADLHRELCKLEQWESELHFPFGTITFHFKGSLLYMKVNLSANAFKNPASRVEEYNIWDERLEELLKLCSTLTEAQAKKEQLEQAIRRTGNLIKIIKDTAKALTDIEEDTNANPAS